MMHRSEEGSISVEVSIMGVLLIVFLLLVIGLGRMSQARFDVTGAAHDAARAASLESNASAADHAARAAADAALADRGLSCAQMNVDVNTAAFRPGGEVTAQVTCVADLSDLSLVWVPGSRTFSEEAVAPIEQYRTVDQ